jgi:hypothetical protein
MSGHGEGAPPSARTDLILAAVFFVFAAAVISASLAMPTFTDQGSPAYVAPGIVPGFHGIVIGILSILLAARSVARGAFRPAGRTNEIPSSRASLLRICLATILALVFAAGMIGRLPFWLAATIFVWCFIMAFEWEPSMPRRQLGINAAIALGIGLATGIGITTVFERLFLIRMP